MENTIYNKVKQIVELVTGVKIIENNRKREVIDARMIYAKILRERGASLVSIGMTINKDHTTIIHYLRTMDSLLITDREVIRKYIKSKELLLLDEQDLNLLNENDTVSELSRLKETLEISEKKVKLLQDENEKLNREMERFRGILKIIDEATPMGQEEIVERKIKRMLDE
jgi:Ulp1 family protease